MIVSLLVATAFNAAASATEKAVVTTESILQKEYNLAEERSLEPRYYYMETKVVYFEADGTRMSPITLRLHLMCVPAGQSAQDGYQYTCAKYTFQQGQAAETPIPALDGWSYLFKRTEDGSFNQGGLVLGIDHGKFQSLADSNGNAMTAEMNYAIYNTFIDFHSFCNVFAERTATGQGIQHLNQIGQKIIHESAFSEPSTHLAGSISEGSSFKNGEVTLEFKGLSIMADVPCAIVGFDSGDSSFTMLVNPAPEMTIKTVGASHYWGDLYIELDSKWVRKVVMGELVVSKVTIGEQKTINAVMERSTTIKAVSRDDCEGLTSDR